MISGGRIGKRTGNGSGLRNSARGTCSFERLSGDHLAEFGRSKVAKLSEALQLDPSEVWSSYGQAVQLALHKSETFTPS